LSRRDWAPLLATQSDTATRQAMKRMFLIMREINQAHDDHGSAESNPLPEEGAPTAEYIQFTDALALLRAGGARETTRLQAVLLLSAAACFACQLECCEVSRRVKRETDQKPTREVLEFDHLGLKAARQGAALVALGERIKPDRKAQAPS